MKQYYATIKINLFGINSFIAIGVEANSKEQAIKVLKDLYLEKYNIEIDDKEIVEINEDTDNE